MNICHLYTCNQSDFIYQIISLFFLFIFGISLFLIRIKKTNLALLLQGVIVALEGLLFILLFIPSTYLSKDLLFPFFYLRNSYDLAHISMLLMSTALLLLHRNFRFKYDLFSYFLIGVGVFFTNFITLINKLLHTSPFTEIGATGISLLTAFLCILSGYIFIKFIINLDKKSTQILNKYLLTPTMFFCICLVSLTLISHIFQKDELEILKSTQKSIFNSLEVSLTENIESEISSLNLLAEIRGKHSIRPPSTSFLETSRDVILSRELITSAYWISPRGEVLWSLTKNKRNSSGFNLLFRVDDYLDLMADFPRRLFFSKDSSQSQIVETVLPYFREGVLYGLIVLQIDFQKLLKKTLKQIEPSEQHNILIQQNGFEILTTNDSEIFPEFASHYEMDIFGKIFHISISPSRFRLTEFVTIIPILVFFLGFLGSLLLGHTLYIYRHLTLSYDEIEREIQIRTQELEESKLRAETANQTKTLFLANISHEIRTPLNIISGMAELLSETQLNNQQAHYVTLFQRSCGNLLRLVNDLIDISKVESGKVELHNSPFSLKSLSEEIISLYKIKANEKSIQLISNLEDIRHEWYLGDTLRIKQVIGNILINSIKFTNAGGVTMRVWTHDDKICIRITDTGIGIPKDQINSIFDTFKQLDNKYTRSVGGAGLGLSIAKKLIEIMGGNIQVSSEIGAGTTFHFYFKLEKTNPECSLGTLNKNSSEMDLKNNLRILIVDDSAENRELIKLFLKKFNPLFTEAENGLEAYEKFQTADYDVVLMDMQMPILDGYDSTQKIRAFEIKQERPQTPIIAITAHAMKEDRVRCILVGCNEYLPKPLNRIDLIQSIQNQIRT